VEDETRNQNEERAPKTVIGLTGTLNRQVKHSLEKLIPKQTVSISGKKTVYKIGTPDPMGYLLIRTDKRATEAPMEYD
jgi:hypothetical protein